MAFVVDVFAQRIVAWNADTTKHTPLVLTALRMGLWARLHDGHPVTAGGLVHHSDAGSQGEINWSSQHLERGGVGWEEHASRCRSRLWGRVGSGLRIGRCGRRCGHRVGRSPHVRCSGSSGGVSRRG